LTDNNVRSVPLCLFWTKRHVGQISKRSIMLARHRYWLRLTSRDTDSWPMACVLDTHPSWEHGHVMISEALSGQFRNRVLVTYSPISAAAVIENVCSRHFTCHWKENSLEYVRSSIFSLTHLTSAKSLFSDTPVMRPSYGPHCASCLSVRLSVCLSVCLSIQWSLTVNSKTKRRRITKIGVNVFRAMSNQCAIFFQNVKD